MDINKQIFELDYNTTITIRGINYTFKGCDGAYGKFIKNSEPEEYIFISCGSKIKENK